MNPGESQRESGGAPPPRRRRLGRWAAAVLGLLLAGGAWFWLALPDVAPLAVENPATTAFMEARRERLRRAGEPAVLDYRFVAYESISPALRRAVLIAEDDAFYLHEGVDMAQVKLVLAEGWEKKRLARGASTITQQLAKNLYLSSSRNPLRKLAEVVIARRLERTLSKKRILELYLNVAEWGERTYGAEAAARRYFGTSAARLTPPQAALLAASLPNPRAMNPHRLTSRLRSRQRLILSRMRRRGYVLPEELPPAQRRRAEDAAAGAPSAPSDTTEATPAAASETPVPETTETPEELAPAAPPPVPDVAATPTDTTE